MLDGRCDGGNPGFIVSTQQGGAICGDEILSQIIGAGREIQRGLTPPALGPGLCRLPDSIRPVVAEHAGR